MTAPVNKMLRGMEEYFLSQETIKAQIGSRLTRGLSDIRIVSQEKPEQTVASRTQRFVEYDLAGADRTLLLNAKSKFHVTTVDFRFFGQFISHAAEVYDAFADLFERLSTTWGSGSDYETKVHGARWDENTASDDRDQTLGMAFMQVSLIVPFQVV
jgi:hypothetical protein